MIRLPALCSGLKGWEFAEDRGGTVSGPVQARIEHNPLTAPRRNASNKTLVLLPDLIPMTSLTTKKKPRTDRNRSGDIPFLSSRSKVAPLSAEARLFHPGRSSDSWINLPTAPSRYGSPVTVATCGLRPHLQRRAHPRFSRGSLLGSETST